MQGPLNRYILLARRWAWVLLLGIVVCGGISYVVSKFSTPTYQASTVFVINVDPTSSTNATSSITAVPTYAQLLTNPMVLNPVVAKHRDMSLQQLSAMIAVRLQTNTQLIELDVQNKDPRLAAQVANEVGQSFLQYSNSQLPGSVLALPAIVPTTPVKPKPLQNAGIGALIGLAFAITLVVVFEWMEDLLVSPEEARELLAMDVLAIIPSDNERNVGSRVSVALVERYRRLVARLNAAQAIIPSDNERNVGSRVSVALVERYRRLVARLNAAQAIIPSDNERNVGSRVSVALVERYRRLAARLNAAQAIKPFKLVMVTSALAGEGKSTIAANLSIFLALAGKRVLLIDANMRHPVLDRYFQLDDRQGVSNVFVEMWTSPRPELYGQETVIPGLRVLISGALPDRPTELLQSPLVHSLFQRLKEAPFDFVIFDSPPLLPVADAEIMCSLVQSVVLVIDASKTPRRTLTRAKRVLTNMRVRGVGIALNKRSWHDDGADPGDLDIALRQEDQFLLISRSAPQSAMIMPPHTPFSNSNGDMSCVNTPADVTRPAETSSYTPGDQRSQQ